MRNRFAKVITELAEKDKKIVLLSGDIGNRLFNNYKAIAPERFYNCGVAEANMTGVAAGMAMNGLRPVTYTIASFNIYRCYEQIRLDVCYQNLPVIIVGTGAGLSYSQLNPTHHSCEDIAVMRVLPNMTVICPGDSNELEALLKQSISLNGPVYFRIGKKNEPIVYKNLPDVKIGKVSRIRKGDKVCIINTGTTLPIALEAGKKLDAEVVNMHTVKPLDTEYLQKVCKKFNLIITVEEHSIIGGLGAAVSEFLTDNDISSVKLRKVAIPDKFLEKTGKQAEARKMAGLTVENIIKIAKQAL